MQKPPIPLTVARHCAKVTKPQLVAPKPSLPPPYCAHHGYSISARAGVAINGATAKSATAPNKSVVMFVLMKLLRRLDYP
jgi:hypothetical protein